MTVLSRVFVLTAFVGQVISLHTPSAGDIDGAVLSEGETHASNTTKFDCNDGYATWQRGWSGAKMYWCCMNDAKGCPESAADVKTRKKAKLDMAEVANKSDALAVIKSTIAKNAASVQQKQQAVAQLQAQVVAKQHLLTAKKTTLEALYETNSKKAAKEKSLLQASDKKEQALKMRQYGVKMAEEEMAERVKQLDVKMSEINVTEKRTTDSKTDVTVLQAKLKVSLAELQKETADYYKHKNSSELDMKHMLQKYKSRKETALHQKAVIATKNAALHDKVRDFKKREDSVNQQEWAVQDREQALEKKVRRVQEDKEERAALSAVKSNAVKEKEEKITSQISLITEKKKQIEDKQALIVKLEAELASKVEGKN